MNPDELQRLLDRLGAPKVPIIAEFRVHPQTHAGIKERFAQVGKPLPGALYFGIRITTDPSIGIGWLHEHDAKGNLIRRIPPIGLQRQVAN